MSECPALVITVSCEKLFQIKIMTISLRLSIPAYGLAVHLQALLLSLQLLAFFF
jgi:hypothetical protein